jgi:hypothetical protein
MSSRLELWQQKFQEAQLAARVDQLFALHVLGLRQVLKIRLREVWMLANFAQLLSAELTAYIPP